MGGTVRRVLGLVLVMLVAATAVAACGSAGGRDVGDRATRTRVQPQASRPPAASAVMRAKRALVRLADMPDGWSEQKGDVARLDCGGFEPFAGADTLVRSPRLTWHHTGVQERIALYRSPAAAARALRRLDSDRAASCLRRELQRHVSAEAESPASPAELVRQERLTATSHATRYVSTAVGNFGKIVGVIDAVHVRAGRSLAALAIVSSPDPLDVELYDRIVGLVAHRLGETQRG